MTVSQVGMMFSSVILCEIFKSTITLKSANLVFNVLVACSYTSTGTLMALLLVLLVLALLVLVLMPKPEMFEGNCMVR